MSKKNKINKKNLYKKITNFEPTIQLYLSVALFLASVIASRGADMQDWEVKLFKALYHSPEFLKSFFFFVTQAGTIHLLGLITLFLFLRKRYDVLFKFLSASFFAYLATGFAKDIWGRTRPFEFLKDIINLDYQVHGPGFPSGHTALAVAMAMTVYGYLPAKYRFIVPIWIILVGWSRVYLGIHAPLDVVGGFAIGWASYALVSHLRVTRIVKKVVNRRIDKHKRKT